MADLSKQIETYCATGLSEHLKDCAHEHLFVRVHLHQSLDLRKEPNMVALIALQKGTQILLQVGLRAI